ncbi:MAG: 4-alpha-glucanotransferase, partial [bacterium]
MDERLAARQAGILMPVASLPEGSFGQGSRRFVDLCVMAGFRIWQILPLGPLGYGNSPYQTLSSLAGDDIYIDLAALHEEGLLASLPPPFPAEEPARVDYNGLRRWREPFLREACRAFYEKGTDAAFAAFREKGWVYPWGVFMALKKQNGLVEWARWPEEQRDWPLRKDYDLAHLGEEIDFQIFLQYEFFRQWDALRRYANGKGLSIMGDVPFYVGHDSLDVWLDREDFLLDEHFAPTEVAGVPPDCFSNLGQRWGNPLYRWDRMEEKGFSFWVERIRAAGALCDIVRIDHFRAFDTYWAIPASCPTAVEGEWR